MSLKYRPGHIFKEKISEILDHYIYFVIFIVGCRSLSHSSFKNTLEPLKRKVLEGVHVGKIADGQEKQ